MVLSKRQHKKLNIDRRMKGRRWENFQIKIHSLQNPRTSWNVGEGLK